MAVNLEIFARYITLTKNSLCCCLITGRQISIIFARATTAVLACAKYCSDHFDKIDRQECKTKFP